VVLYDNPVSSNALKVRFLLADLGLAYDRREVPLSRPRPDWYLAINPVGGVPAIDDDGFVLAESNTILRYLASREGRLDLAPVEPAGRARVDEFLDRWSATFRPAFFRVEAHVFGMGGTPVDLDAAKAAAGEIGDTLRLLETLVAGETVLGTLTIADFAVAPVLFRTTHLPLDLEAFPRLARLRESLTRRPSFAAAGPVR
jgi:glutathione S-transferase